MSLYPRIFVALMKRSLNFLNFNFRRYRRNHSVNKPKYGVTVIKYVVTEVDEAITAFRLTVKILWPVQGDKLNKSVSLMPCASEIILS